MRAYHLHVFFILANLNIQKSLKHSSTRRGKAELSGLLARRVQCTRREPCLTDSKTERSSPSYHPASERTNSNRCLNKQTEKGCERCAQGARRETVSNASTLLLTESLWSLTRMNPVKPKIIQTPNIFVYIFY